MNHTIELNACQNELIREILDLDNLELLKDVKNYLERLLTHTAQDSAEKENLKPYTMEEINGWIAQGEAEEAAGLVYTCEEADKYIKAECSWLQ